MTEATCAACPNPTPESDIPGLKALLCPECEARCPADLVAMNRAAAVRARQAIERRDSDGIGRAMREVEQTARKCVEAVRG